MLERCVLVNGASEDLRVAGLRAANVFMARSAKANERDAVSAAGESMRSKGDSCHPVFIPTISRYLLLFPRSCSNVDPNPTS